MKNYNKLKIFIFTVSTFYFLFSTFYSANAQTSPEFLVSWQAQSYSPSWYLGKILPTKDSQIKINFELIDSGKIVSLSKNIVRWYVNDKLVLNEKNGLGVKSYSFIAPDYPGQETEIRITIPDYKGKVLDKIIVLPIAGPEAVIDNSYPNREVFIGKSRFSAHPFFFNIKNKSGLAFEWLVNNQKAASGENQEILDLNIDPLTPSKTEIDISVKIKNLFNEMEFAAKNIKLMIR